MEEKKYTVYGYRWVVLLVFALLNLAIQLNWITFAPITVDSISLYHASAFQIVLLSMSFMVVYLVFSVPASYIIDKYGTHIGVGIGAVLTGVFSYLRGVYADDYTMVCVCQFALAVAQPFIMNAMTRVAADWFPIQERATATGITALAQFVGIIVAMAVTKPLAQSYLSADAGGKLDLTAIGSMLQFYGIVSIVCAVLFLVFARNKPASPPSSEEDSERYSVFEGIKHLLKQSDMRKLLLIFFIGLGMFNAISTFVDLILASKGFVAGGNESGNVGAVMMVAGVLGAIIIPTISDKRRKRKLYMVICTIGLIPGLVGLTFFTDYLLLVISSGLFGFFFMAAAPLGYQYAAEVSHPAPESTSQGLIVLSGQLSGAIFITLMAVLGNITMEVIADANKASESMNLTPFMIVFVVLGVVNVFLALSMKESTRITTQE
ncbi:MAG: major facilitator superfamily domain-containing protein 7 [bacterium]|nr:major facilitator superfamily domain-containing protein 7 [bacterium]